MNLPKKLQEDSKLFPRHIVDENKKDVALIYSYEKRPEVKQEIIKRYNTYPILKWWSVIATIAFCALFTYVQCKDNV